MWPWAAIAFPSNLYSSATASNPGQQLLRTTSKWRVGPWHPISACRSGEQSGELRRWKRRHREVKGQYGAHEYWMPNVISFVSARVSALSATELILRGSAGTRRRAATIPVTSTPQQWALLNEVIYIQNHQYFLCNLLMLLYWLMAVKCVPR